LFNRSIHLSAALPLGVLPFLAGAFIIFMLSIQNNYAIRPLNTALIDLTTPLVNIISHPFTALLSNNEFLRSRQSLYREITTLREEKKHYLYLVQSLQQKTVDYEQLRQLAHAMPDPDFAKITARVVGRISDGINATLMVRATKEIVKDQPVITAEGVVGRVSDVGRINPSLARIMPLTDLASRIPVEIESTGEHGILAGHNEGELHLVHLEKRVKVKVGDRLITSGYGGIFPRGLPVALITQIKGDKVKASPFVKQTPAFVTILLSL
jgi:rod shape-determining protein MreC